VVKVTQAHQRARRGHHQVAVFQSNQGDEEADARGDADLQAVGNRVDYFGTYARECSQNEKYPGQEYGRQRHRRVGEGQFVLQFDSWTGIALHAGLL
jgi:hypothetical protein